MGDWIWNPMIGFRPLLGLMLLGVALAAWVYVRLMRRHPIWASALMAWRLLMVGFLVTLLAGPSRVPKRQADTGPSHLYLLMDVSGSMQRQDVEGRSRWSVLSQEWLGAAQLEALRRDHAVTLLGFDERLRSLSAEDLNRPAGQVAVGRRSAAGAAIGQLLDRLAPARKAQVIWFGDGRDSAPIEPVAEKARDRGVVIHAVSAGTQVETPDLAVRAEPPAAFLMTGEKGILRVQLRRAGLSGPATYRVRLSGEGTEPRTRAATFKANQTSEDLLFQIRHEQPGRYAYRVQ
ncbi:MAG: hypothetical protein R3236_10935, partial [Phycisphaeraceae bacterium]|nr:hypothetical protein [Phycisphaeraceae bacterium]